MSKHFITQKISTLLALLPLSALAQGVKLSNPAPGAGATMQDFIYLLIEIIRLIGIPVLTVCIVYAGFLFVTAGGSEDQVTKAKGWIFWTLVGATIILGSRVIADVVYGTASAF